LSRREDGPHECSEESRPESRHAELQAQPAAEVSPKPEYEAVDDEAEAAEGEDEGMKARNLSRFPTVAFNAPRITATISRSKNVR